MNGTVSLACMSGSYILYVLPLLLWASSAHSPSQHAFMLTTVCFGNRMLCISPSFMVRLFLYNFLLFSLTVPNAMLWAIFNAMLWAIFRILWEFVYSHLIGVSHSLAPQLQCELFTT